MGGDVKIETHYTQVVSVNFTLTEFDVSRAVREFIERHHSDRMIPDGCWEEMGWGEAVIDGQGELEINIHLKAIANA